MAFFSLINRAPVPSFIVYIGDEKNRARRTVGPAKVIQARFLSLLLRERKKNTLRPACRSLYCGEIFSYSYGLRSVRRCRRGRVDQDQERDDEHYEAVYTDRDHANRSERRVVKGRANARVNLIP